MARSFVSHARRRTGLPAACLAALVALTVAACSGGTGPDDDDGGTGAAQVTVSPAAETLTALGAAVNLSVSGTTTAGEGISDSDVVWTSTDGTVASVNEVGLVQAMTNGTAQVVAALADGAAADTAEITVDQEVVAVQVSPADVSLPALGDTAHFAASAEDPNGNAVEKELSFAWSSTDTLVLTVDEDGVATARDTGEAEVVATVSDSSGRARVEVARPDPEITEVSPETLEEGGSAVIRGSAFGDDASGVEVLIDGEPAAVTAFSSTEIEVTVPLYDCRPPRDVEVQVIVDGDASDPVSSSVRPGEDPTELAAGEQLVISRPDQDFCVRLDEASGEETYLVGIQSVTQSLGATSAQVTLDRGDADVAASTAGGFPVTGASADRGGGVVPSASRGAATAGLFPHASTPEVRLREWERRHLGPHLSSSIPRRRGADRPPRARSTTGEGGGAPLAASIGSNPTEGDTVPIRVPDLTANDACASYEEISAVIRKVGTRGIWLEDVDNPDDGFTSNDYQEMSDQFDDPVHGTLTDYFGEPTDIDSNDRVAVVVTKELNEFGGVLGFVFGGDLFPRESESGTSCSSSEEGELTYTLAPDPDGTFGDTVSVESMRRTYPGLVAHEVTHVIQFGRRFECAACDFPVVWITEGQATLAEELAGHAVSGRTTGQNYGFEVAFDPDDSDDSDWYRDIFVDLAVYYGFRNQNEREDDAPHRCSWQMANWDGPCLGGRGVYGVPATLFRWINDHLGPGYPGGEQALQRDITGNDDLGFANLEEVTGESMKSLLADWGPMLWTDDRVSGVPDRLTLPSWDMVDVFSNLVTTARLTPAVHDFSGFSESVGVNAGSAAYFVVGGSDRPPVTLRARTTGGSELPSYMQMWVVRTR